jgi:hypothetical protein
MGKFFGERLFARASQTGFSWCTLFEYEILLREVKCMLRKMVLTVCVGMIGILGGAQAFGQDAVAMAEALDKNKYKKKEKSRDGVNVAFEMYVDIRHEPVVKPPAEYSDTYVDADGGFVLDLRVADDGTVEGSGEERINDERNAGKRSFTLEHGRVNGAVLTADKVFADGSVERLEAVFVNRTTLEGKNAETITSRRTAFGVGFIQKNGEWTNRVFLSAKYA